ncbi:phosphatidylinositide phosphatase SAC2 isoform X1 [Nasonia vitripennis]|uniref:Phosphatidylinositide phosphatase SAC2 n=1 Tax=Nasonia vitripennis TaxID=7425 RepID=A0A7M7M274_NASVI|nr:phosphatidylinositide phosphatase SAC2 isoform X1 [Nasonia vitripennis]
MELFRSDTHFIFVKESHSLWWDKQTGEFSAKSDWEWASANDLECLGLFYGIVGKIEQANVLETRLMLVKEIASAGELQGGHVVYKIKSVAFLHLGSENFDIGLLPCAKHQHGFRKKPTGGGLFDTQKAGFAKTWGTIKSATNTIKNTTQQAAALATSQVKSTVTKRTGVKDKEKFERRILEELNKIFTETDSFFFCRTRDITNSLQRLCGKDQENQNLPMWQTIDDRFFWNKFMLQDIINLNTAKADCWILPIIQGYVQIEKCQVEVGFDGQPIHEIFNLAIISRRSRFRAGTRYKRRGVDEDGKCANYVETEQLVWYHDHQVSFVQVRGSVPVYWSQPGYKYKPPPRIDRDEAETQVAFEKHFTEELDCYGPICIVNLVEQSGRESVICEAYSNHVLNYNHPDITYTTFDFHEYCRGMHFENVSLLVSALTPVLAEMGYCWHDKQGPICMQKGVFRVNCIDCLDRTNVVQTALGKAVMEIQFSKLGLIPPDGTLPTNLRQTFQLLWANNGDIISKQYAGTNALKGDYTRTGERKFTGLMKDGMNSANRYIQQHFLDDIRQATIDVLLGYPIDLDQLNDDWSHYLNIIDNCCLELIPAKPPNIQVQLTTHPEFIYANIMFDLARYYLNRFKDVYRQATIDMMLGNNVGEEVFQEKTEEEDNAATAVHVKLLIEDCKKLLIPNPEFILNSWGLIDADPVTGDPTETEMDSILILTHDSYYVADYDDQIDKVTNYQRVLLSDIVLIECGQPENTVSLFKNKNHYCIRIHYKVAGDCGYFHMFRSTNLRFFNNMAIVIKTEEETIESLKAIAEAISVAMEIAGMEKVPIAMNVTLDKRKSKLVNVKGHAGLLDIASFPALTRNVSETQLNALKSAGTKALSNMTEQFSKLNKFSHSLAAKRPIELAKSIGRKSEIVDGIKPTFTLGKHELSGKMHQSSSSDGSSTGGSDENIDLIPIQTERPKDFHHDKNLMEAYTPTIGIIMGVQNNEVDEVGKEAEGPSDAADGSLDVNGSNYQQAAFNMKQNCSDSSSQRNLATTPEITIQGVGESFGTASHDKAVPPTSLNLPKNISHSSGEVDNQTAPDDAGSPSGSTLQTDNGSKSQKRSTSEQDLTLTISSSKSESALKNMKSNIVNATSPVSATAKDILSPFSKFAKGVQTLGANLDPRKLKSAGQVGPGGIPRTLSDHHLEERQKLLERWGKCRSRLIAL